MKDISLKLYLFEEMSVEIQQKVIEQHRHVNTMYNWYEYTFNDFIEVCKIIGITLESKNIFFSGFSSQGDGSTFLAHIEPLKFIHAMNKMAWKTYAPDMELNVAPCPCNARVLSLIERYINTVRFHTRKTLRGYSIQYISDYGFMTYRRENYPNIESELEMLDEWVESILNTLNHYLYQSLETEYDYLVNDNAVRETLISEAHYFIASGEIADHLLNLTVEQEYREQGSR